MQANSGWLNYCISDNSVACSHVALSGSQSSSQVVFSVHSRLGPLTFSLTAGIVGIWIHPQIASIASIKANRSV